MKTGIISIGICLLFILTVVNPMTLGYDVKLDIIEPEEGQSSAGNGGPMDSPWPMQCYNLHHTSRSPYSTTNVTGFEKWRCRAGGVEGGIAVDNKGILYFGDWGPKINAVYPNGTRKWIYRTDMWVTSAPAISEDGTLYVTSWDTILRAIDSQNGTLKWKFNANSPSTSSPVIGGDGTIYFGTNGNKFFAIYPNGTKRWDYSADDGIYSHPAISEDGTIFFSSWDKHLYALNSDGTLKWRFKSGDITKGTPSIASDGTVYFGSFDGYLYAIHPDNGTIKWKCKVGLGTETNPSIADDGTIYVGGEKLYAIYPNGTKRWSFNLGTDRYVEDSCPAISSDGTIYIGTHIGEVDGGEIIAVEPDGTEKWRKTIVDSGWVDSSPSIGKDGTVYIGSNRGDGGFLHAFGPQESNSPPEAPTISGRKNGKPREEYWYKITAVDPENNPMRFYIEWGDGTSTGWTQEHASYEKYYYTKTWTKSGTYTVRVKAKDNSDVEGPWGYLEVNIPRTRTSSYHWFLERFPLLDRLLTLLLL